MATAQHGAQNNQPGHTARSPWHTAHSAHPVFFALHLLQPGTFITLWIFSRMNFWNPRILARKQVAFCWWCFFWWIFQPLTLLINILTNIPLLMNISRYIWILLTDILLLMDFLVPQCWWIFWLLSSDGCSTFDEYLSIFLNIFERNYSGLFGPSLLMDILAAEFWRIFYSQASTFELRAYFCIPCQTMLSLGNLKIQDINKRSY